MALSSEAAAAAAGTAAGTGWRARALHGLLPALALLATGGLLFPSSGRDDSYISYWPAHTLARHGALWNLNGEAVEQSSSLLQVGLLAALARLVPLSLPTLGWLLSLASGVGCVVAAAAAERRLGRDYRGARWLVATATPLVYWACSGLETSLAALLGLALVLSWSGFLADPAGRRPGPGVWLATSGFLAVRPESVFVLGAVLAGCAAVFPREGAGALARRRLAWLALASALGFAALAGFRLAVFDALFPQPAAAKSFTRLGGAGLLHQLAGGFDYLVASAGQIFAAGFWIGLGGGVLGLLRAWRGQRLAAFECVGALFCTAFVAFVLTTGGDYMEGPRYLVPCLPVALLLACPVVARHAPSLRRPLVSALVVLQVLGTVVFARHDSTGIPLWDWLAERPGPGAPFGFTESANRVHLRDVPLVRTLSAVVETLGSVEAPVVVLSKQMGMVPYHVALAWPGRARFIDAWGLATRHVTAPEFAELRDAWRADRYGLLFREPERFEALWGASRPDVLFDLGVPPEDLARQGYVLVLRQAGELRARSFLLPGAPVPAAAWIAVRADRMAELAALPGA